jgi:hypothetical protein
MAKYLQRSCPKCNGYLGIVVPERKAKMPVQAINGRCLKCGYRLAWVLVRGKTSAELGASRFNVWYTLEPKKKNRPEVIRTVSSIFGDFCFRTFVPHIDRCYRSRHRGVSCPVAATLSGRS